MSDSEFKVAKANTRSDRYEAPDLFPQFYRYGGDGRREYLSRELVKMARDGTLFLTDILNQAKPIPDTAGQIILGHAIENHHFMAGKRIPPELLDYRVRIKSRNGLSIRWCRDMVKGEEISGRHPGVGGFRPGDAGSPDVPVTYHRVAEEWVDTEQQDVTLRLQDAWIALKANGAFCRPAKRASVQAKQWWFEEVRPTPTATPAPPPAEPATPSKRRGGFAEANG
jgi:hypothetical protein